MTVWSKKLDDDAEQHKNERKTEYKKHTPKVFNFWGVVNAVRVYNLPSIIEKLFEEAVYFFVR